MLRSRNVIFVFAPFDDVCQDLQMYPSHFSAGSYRFRDIKILHFYTKKVGQDHEVPFSQLHHSMANVKIYKCLSHIFAFALTVYAIKKILNVHQKK